MDIRDEYMAGKFDRTEEGIYFPASGILAKGVFTVSKRGEVEEQYENLVVNQGLDYILSAAVGATSPLSNWYIATFSGDVTVLSTWTAANFTANSTEWTTYESATRPVWSRGSVASGGVDSFASKAEFKSTADTQTIRGAALISASAKGAISGTLIAASRFTSDKQLDTDEILDVGYGLQLSAV
jgi:hypothetical protein